MAETGMEHCLHIWLSMMFLYLAVKSIESGNRARALLILSPVMVLVRVESVFLIGICAVLFLMRRRWKGAVALIASASAALGAFAGFSLAHGWAWMPNSILMKGLNPTGQTTYNLALGVEGRIVHNVSEAPHLAFLATLLIFMFLATKRHLPAWDHRRVAVLVVLLAIMAHVGFARVGWIFRYEAYLIALSMASIFVVAPSMRFRGPVAMGVLIFGFLSLQSLVRRTYEGSVNLPKASFNVYEQQFQMARFLQRYFPQAGVAANDIGFISYRTDIRLLDLTGLASWEVFREKRSGTYNTAALASLAATHKIDIAIVYDKWFNGEPSEFGGPRLPSAWTRVCRWRIDDNLYLGDSVVSFYAVRPTAAAELRDALRSYASSLPETVTVMEN